MRQKLEKIGQREPSFLNFRHRLASGEIRDVEVYASPIQTTEGELLYSIIHDVTERHRAEEARETTLEQFKALIGNLQMGVMVETAQRKVIHSNQTFCNLFGLPAPEAILGADCEAAVLAASNFFQDPLQFAERIDHILVKRELVVNEEIYPKDGRIFERDYVPIYLRDEFIGNMWIYRDITERKRMEQQLVQQERLAAVGQLTAGIAHDFNNILAGIVGFTEMLQLSSQTPASMQPSLQQISISSQRATHLVRQLLDFSRKSIRQPKFFALDVFTRETIAFLERTIPENIRITLTIIPGDYLIEADPTQIQQVITNLVVNARDAMLSGGSLLVGLSRLKMAGQEKCAICGEPIRGEWVCLIIADNGSGIPAEVLPHIFEPFFTTKAVGKGTGLGLSQVHGIISQHTGHLTINSRPEQGTKLTIYLPPAATQHKKTAEKASPPMLSGHGETILLVEDEPIVLEASKVMLKYLNYHVLTAPNGQEALALYRRYQAEIALVLSDMVMPDMEGEALFRTLQAEHPGLKMVLMSGYPLGEKGAELLTHGLVAWFEKPISLGQLSQVVGQALANQKGRWA